jgi:hypothetical protein
VRSWETKLADRADADDLANEYEFLILNGLSVPTNLDQIMREAYRRVHLRGLDPLNKTGVKVLEPTGEP